MSSDIDNILNAVAYVHYVWVPLLQLAAAAVGLNYVIGTATWGGVVFIVGVVPVYIVGFGMLQKLQKLTLKKRDERLDVIQEVLKPVRIIKSCALEGGFPSPSPSSSSSP